MAADNYYKPWTKEEEEFLKKNYIKKGKKYCSDKLGRTLVAVMTRAAILKISDQTSPKYFTEKENEFLLDNYKTKGCYYCAEVLNKDLKVVIDQAYDLKII